VTERQTLVKPYTTLAYRDSIAWVKIISNFISKLGGIFFFPIDFWYSIKLHLLCADILRTLLHEAMFIGN